MWDYSGLKDSTRISEADLSTAELEKLARQFRKLITEDAIPSSFRVTPFDKNHPPPSVSSFDFIAKHRTFILLILFWNF
jgi:hypothetical protein